MSSATSAAANSPAEKVENTPVTEPATVMSTGTPIVPKTEQPPIEDQPKAETTPAVSAGEQGSASVEPLSIPAEKPQMVDTVENKNKPVEAGDAAKPVDSVEPPTEEGKLKDGGQNEEMIRPNPEAVAVAVEAAAVVAEAPKKEVPAESQPEIPKIVEIADTTSTTAALVEESNSEEKNVVGTEGVTVEKKVDAPPTAKLEEPVTAPPAVGEASATKDVPLVAEDEGDDEGMGENGTFY